MGVMSNSKIIYILIYRTIKLDDSKFKIIICTNIYCKYKCFKSGTLHFLIIICYKLIK